MDAINIKLAGTTEPLYKHNYVIRSHTLQIHLAGSHTAKYMGLLWQQDR